MKFFENEKLAFLYSIESLLTYGQYVENPKWQGTETQDNPEANEMWEFLNLSFRTKMTNEKNDLIHLLSDLSNDSLEWAEEHFQERVSGIPYNPPPSYVKWQNGTSGDYLLEEGSHPVFSHTYPERFWVDKVYPDGVRYKNGNLDTLVRILQDNPSTRQAFLPMFLPEDLTASLEGERVPCSLGWHFILRNGFFHVFYSLRSCDSIRHFLNDLYLTVRLSQWVKEKAFGGKSVKLGFLSFNVISFHCFRNDLYTLKKLNEKTKKSCAEFL